MTDKAYDKFSFDLDFFELALKEKAEKKRVIQEQEEAKNPKITEIHLKEAEERGRQIGYTEGVEAGKKEMQQELDTYVSAIKSRMDEISRIKSELQDVSSQKSVQILQKLLRMLIHSTADKYSEELLTETIKTALGKVLEDVRIIMHLNASAVNYVNTHPELSELIEKHNVRINENSQISPHDCVLEWETGGIDARLDNALNDIDSQLSSAIMGTHPSASSSLKIDKPLDTSTVDEESQEQEETTSIVEETFKTSTEVSTDEIPEKAIKESTPSDEAISTTETDTETQQ